MDKRDSSSIAAAGLVIEPLEANEVLALRAHIIRAIKPISIQDVSMDKKSLRVVFTAQAPLEKDGKTIRFFGRTFDKNYRSDGLFKYIAPDVRRILENSQLAYTEKEKYTGTIRKDGTTHKMHRDVKTYDNYVGRVLFCSNSKEYYVRITVVNTGTDNTGVHSHFISEVQLYEKAHGDSSNPTIRRERLISEGLTDAKLQAFFEIASAGLEKER